MNGRTWVLCVALIAALVVGASATTAAAADATSDRRLCLAAPTGHDLSAYQVFAGDFQSDGSLANIRWGSGVVKDALLAELTKTDLDGVYPFAGVTSARELADVVGVPREGGADTTLAETVARVATHHLASGTPFSGREEGSFAAGLEAGYYVVASTHAEGNQAGSLVFPALIAVNEDMTSITPKEAAPTLTKLVQENTTGVWDAAADASTGDDLAFCITVSLPEALMERDAFTLRIVDELPPTMTLDESSLSVNCGSSDIAELFSVAYEGSRLVLESGSLAGAGLPLDCSLEILYRAKLEPSAGTGAPGSVNRAWLEVEAEGERCRTPTAATAVLSYGLQISKVDAADHATKLAGAEFVLEREDGTYAVFEAGSVAGWTKAQADATRLTSDENGFIRIAGLDAGSYLLRETAAPSGYACAGAGIPLTIESNFTFDVAREQGAIMAIRLSSGSSSSQGDAELGMLYCTVENTRLAALSSSSPSAPGDLGAGNPMPATGDVAQKPWLLGLVGGLAVFVACLARLVVRRAATRRAHRALSGLAVPLVLLACLCVGVAGLPAYSLADEGSSVLVATPDADAADAADTTAEGLVVGAPDDTAPTEDDGPSEGSETSGALIDGFVVENVPVDVVGPTGLSYRTDADAGALRGSMPSNVTSVASERAIPRSTTNSYINVFNLSYENAYIMVNDTTNFACDTAPVNSYAGVAFDTDALSGMVLYKGPAGAYGAGMDDGGIDSICDTSGNGLVAIWFKDAAVLSDTGESVSMLLRLSEFHISPNYEDIFDYVDNGEYISGVASYRQYQDVHSGVPLLYIFGSGGVNQTKPSGTRLWMNSVWCSKQVWSVSFYRSSAIPSGYAQGRGYSMRTLGLSDNKLVDTATNGKTYLARQYCYDLDIAGIRWLEADGSFDPESPFVTKGDPLFSQGGAYLTGSGAESFAPLSGLYGNVYISSSTNLKTDSYLGTTYWLHDENKGDGGEQTGNRWHTVHSSPTDWRNALGYDVLPQSSFAWVGAQCSTGLNLNSQFTGTGTLRLGKTVDVGTTKAFPFKVVLEAPDYSTGALTWVALGGSYPYAVLAADNSVVASGTLQSGNSVSLAGGQTLYVTDIPEGTRYTVSETAHAGYRPTQQTATGTIVDDNFVGTIVNGAINSVDVKNLLLLSPADWTIVKRGNDNVALAGAEFLVCHYATQTDTTPTRSWTIKTDSTGKAKLDASHLVSGSNFFIDAATNKAGLPAGIVTIQETKAPDGYVRDSTVYRYTITDTGGSLSSTIPATLTVKNELETGTLVVAKRLQGTGANAEREFSFTVKLSAGGSPLNGIFGGVRFSGGIARFTLRGGESKTIADIPAGTAFEVSEEAFANYTVNWSTRTGTIPAGKSITATATNSYTASGAATIRLSKEYETNGPELAEGQFGFELHAGSASGTVVARASCTAEGSITFDVPITANSIGKSLTYYATEIDDGQAGVVYDTRALKVVVDVSQASDDSIKTTVSYPDGTTFTNSHLRYLLPETGLDGVAPTVLLGSALCVAATAVLRPRVRRPR